MPSSFIFAQRGPRAADREKLEVARVAFISTRLDLSAEQAQTFWPIFNDFDKKRRVILRQISSLSKNVSMILEDEARNRIQKRFELQNELIDVEREFVKEVSQVINYNQILLLNEINKGFTRSLLQRQKRKDAKNLQP